MEKDQEEVLIEDLEAVSLLAAETDLVDVMVIRDIPDIRQFVVHADRIAKCPLSRPEKGRFIAMRVLGNNKQEVEGADHNNLIVNVAIAHEMIFLKKRRVEEV